MSLPSELGNLRKLTALFLTDNMLESLPNEIGHLTSLKRLQASKNNFKSLPPEIALCTDLEVIRMAVSKLTSLPPEIALCTNLAWIAFSSNPLSENVKPLQSPFQIDKSEISVTGTNLASVDYSGASNDGVLIGSYKGVPIAIK